MKLIIILLVTFIDFLGLWLVFPLFSYLLFNPEAAFLSADVSEDIRGFYFGLLLALFSVGQFISGPFLGTFSDEVGRRKVLIWSLFIGIFGYFIGVLGIVFKSMPLLLVSRIVNGISSGNAGVVQAALADISTPETKMKYFAYHNVSMGLGLTLGPFLGGILSQKATIPFWIGSLITLFSLLLIAFSYKESPFVSKVKKISLLDALTDLKKAFHMKGIRMLLLSIFVFIFGWAFYFEFISIYLVSRYHFSSSEVGYFYGYSALLFALCSGFLIMPIIKRMKIEKVLFSSMFLTGICTFLYFFVTNAFYFLIFLIPLIYFFSFVLPISTTLVSNWAGDGVQGESLGIYQSIQTFAWAMAPLFSGALLGLYDFMPVVIGGSSLLLGSLLYGLSLCQSKKR